MGPGLKSRVTLGRDSTDDQRRTNYFFWYKLSEPPLTPMTQGTKKISIIIHFIDNGGSRYAGQLRHLHAPGGGPPPPPPVGGPIKREPG